MRPEFKLNREKSNSLYAHNYPYASCELHFHSNVELLLVIEGEVDAWVNDRHKVLRGGDMLVALSYDAHCFHSVTEGNLISLIIPTSMCPEFVAAVSDKQVVSPFVRDDALFETVCSCYSKLKAATNDLTVKGYLQVILGSLMEHVELKQQQETMEVRLFADILLYISQNFEEDISLASVAAAVGYNSSYLSRAFRKSFRMGVSEYITLVRLRKAVLLMRENGRGVTECAFESGFHSIRTFYRVFEKEFGCTPKEYLQYAKR